MLISVTLSNRTDDMIEDALRSVVDHVDACLVVSTHGVPYSFDRERAVVGDKLRTAAIAPIITPADTARARNDGLDHARRYGADWALVLDTDERIAWRGDVESVLSSGAVDAIVLRADDGSYGKDKFLRPGTGEYRALAHEAWVPSDPARRLSFPSGPRFSELPKDKAALDRRDRAVISVLKQELKRDSKDPRTHFYLGQSYHSLGKLKLAEKHYLACARSSDQHWAEEAGWACYRVGQLRLARGDIDLAYRAFSVALTICPALAEAAYWLGYISVLRQRPQDALAWATTAICGGAYQGLHESYGRIHFREPQYLWEAPFELLRAVYHALGKADLAAQSTQEFRAAYRRRISEDGGPALPDDDWHLHQDVIPDSMVA